MPEHTNILLATLGGQPQVVTFTLDLLLQKGFPISEVIVVHPKASPLRLQRSLARLSAEFIGDYHNEPRTIHFHSHVLQLDGEPIDDITDDPHADGTLETLHKLIGSLKRQGCHIHLSVTGGRRLMSLLAISVAALNFDRHDHIWHIYTPEAVRDQAKDGQLMHVPATAGVKLIQGQFIALGAYIYNESFRTTQQEQRAQMDAAERARCVQVVKDVTPAQRKVLEAFSAGLRPQQVAAHLNIELVTVHTHKTVLLRLCRNAWNIDTDEHLDYHFLHTKFSSYFERNNGNE